MKTKSVPKIKHLHCDQCEMLAINNIATHEIGCPIAWKDYPVECSWCGTEFMPEEKRQKFCDESCAEAYYN